MYRFIGGLVIALGCAIYFAVLLLGSIQWNEDATIHSSLFQELKFIVGLGFGAGLPPIIVAIAYLFFADSMGRLLAGCFAVIAFIVFHYVTLVCMAHGTPYIYMPLAVVEFTLSIWVAYRCGHAKSKEPTR